MRKSTYLYSKENRELYHEHLKDISSDSCHFSRQIPLFLERVDKNDMNFFARHLVHCDKCQNEIRKEEQKRKSFINLVPYEKMSREQLLSLGPELDELAEIIFKKEGVEQLKLKAESYRARRQFVYDMFISPFYSKTFLKGLVLALFSFSFLYFISH